MAKTLVVKFDSLDAILATLGAAHDDLITEVADIRKRVDSLLIGWQVDTDSRRSQLAFDTRLGRQLEALMEALARIRTELDGVAESARSTEVRNVAVLD